MMPAFSDLLALWLFVIFMVGTPGPANMVAMAAGAQFGLRRSLWFLYGLTAGKFLLNLAMAFGLLVLLSDYPVLQDILKYISASYMLYLAARSWHQSGQPQSEASQLGFWQGLFVHPLNPKAWVMSIIAWTEFGPMLGPAITQLIVIPLTFVVVQMVSHTAWCALGELTARALPNNLLLTRSLILLTVAVVLWAVFL